MSEPEVYERLRGVEVTQGRHDERLKMVEEVIKEVKQIKFATYTAVAAIVAQIIFKVWK